MINWSDFQKLPGSPDNNFELLCRSLIRLQYGKFGQFAGLANQPGVEFHLRLDSDCALGAPGRWFGWQCRWYDLPSGKPLGSARRKKIEESLAKTAKALPELTDWILWTRNPLTKADQDWFYALETAMKLNLWVASDVETLLSGEAEMLRRTYFGELVLTPPLLKALHDVSVAPIRRRWLPEAHQTVDAERTIRRMLGEAESWEEIVEVARRLLAAVSFVNKEPRATTGKLSPLAAAFTQAAQQMAGTMQSVHRLLTDGDLGLLRLTLDSRVKSVTKDVSAAPRKMRGARLECGLIATNALADLKYGIELLDNVDSFLGVRMVGVLADAGGGKTQLSAQLTAEVPRKRPAGIFLRGSELHSGRTLDDLAKSVTIQGLPIPSMEALLAAVDAAGQRAKRRLPIIIDGLNEAENPTDWKAPLSSLAEMLNRFANVLVVCTVRTGARTINEREWSYTQEEETPARLDFAKQALPDQITQIELPGFGSDTLDAIEKYFGHFKINPGDEELPFELLTHPLTLRLFCEVTNPERNREVGMEAMPRSLTGLFERYVDRTTERIAELSARNHRYHERDIRLTVNIIATKLWESSSRELEEHGLRQEIKDDARPWNESIVHLLEQEGIILLVPGESPERRNIIAVYDALGGYLIANAILAKHGDSTFAGWLKETKTVDALMGGRARSHPLSSDVFASLVGLVPRRFHSQQVWQLIDEPLRSPALRLAAALEGKFLDTTTVEALRDQIRQRRPHSERLFLQLSRTRASPGHPLNADFLDATLRLMEVAERDLHWTEWVRRNSDDMRRYDRQFDFRDDVQDLERRWKGSISSRSQADRLRAKWLMWLLPSTIHNLRDRVTRAIYWFGRGDPVALFEMTMQAADINDPYVFERMLAASYGVAMAEHCNPQNPSFRKAVLSDFARRIFDGLFKESAPQRTTHLLTREYGRRLIELASAHNRKLFTPEETARSRPPYSDGGRIVWGEGEMPSVTATTVTSPFRMDFENYTLGRLVDGRRNYDFEHAGYKKARAQVLWRVQQLGWTAERFNPIDRSIESTGYDYGRMREGYYKIDRYGKKYSWIAYFELSGFLQDRGLDKKRDDYGRTWDVDIDPSFPDPTPEERLIVSDFLGSKSLTLANWIRKGPVPNLIPYTTQTSIRGEVASWIALDGFVVQQDESRGRRMFASIRSFFVAMKEADAFATALANQPVSDGWLEDKPQTLYTFAGEIPWCSTFAKTGLSELRFVIKERKVKVKRMRPVLFLDDKPLNLTPTDLVRLKMFGVPSQDPELLGALTENDLKRAIIKNILVESEEVQQEFRKFRALVPVVNFGWEGRTVENVPIHGITLEKQFAQSLGLVNISQTNDLQTNDGVRATYGIAFHPQDFNNSERLFFIRKEILQSYLKKHSLSLVRLVWGERELSNKQMERARPDGDLAGLSRGHFQTVIRF